MEWKLNTILVLVGILVVATNHIQAASKPNGKLLKFYPISKEQYMSILKLSRQQPTISEARLMQHHRSLANWSSSLHNSWNSLFNYTRPDSNGEVIKGYPICVLRTDELTERTKRDATQYDNAYNYAGLVPTVVYNGPPDYSHYGRPPHHGPPYDNDGEADVEDEEQDNEYPTEEPDESDTNTNSPIVNCVVVIHRQKKTTTRPSLTAETEEEYTKPSYGYPTYLPYPHYSYRPPQTPSYGYPAYDPSNPLPKPPPSHYPYPPPPGYGYPPHFGSEHTPKYNQMRSHYSAMNPAADAYYRQMLNEYNHHLNSLYMADATTQ